MTDKLSSGYWLDVHLIRGKTLRLFYQDDYHPDVSKGHMIEVILSDLSKGVVLYTDDKRPVRVYRRGIAAIEMVEAVAPEASCDDTAENTT